MKFYHENLELEIYDSVYYPREDSLLLAKVLENRLVNKKILDMGCGSGFLAILLANDNNVTACDINEEAIKITEKNAERNNVKITAVQSDLFLQIKERFDIIVFNPPYLPTEDEDIQWDGGRSGRDIIEKFIAQAKNHLFADGKVLLLISSLTGEKEVLDLFERNSFDAKIIARQKIPWEELMVIEAKL